MIVAKCLILFVIFTVIKSQDNDDPTLTKGKVDEDGNAEDIKPTISKPKVDEDKKAKNIKPTLAKGKVDEDGNAEDIKPTIFKGKVDEDGNAEDIKPTISKAKLHEDGKTKVIKPTSSKGVDKVKKADDHLKKIEKEMEDRTDKKSSLQKSENSATNGSNITGEAKEDKPKKESLQSTPKKSLKSKIGGQGSGKTDIKSPDENSDSLNTGEGSLKIIPKPKAETKSKNTKKTKLQTEAETKSKENKKKTKLQTGTHKNVTSDKRTEKGKEKDLGLGEEKTMKDKNKSEKNKSLKSSKDLAKDGSDAEDKDTSNSKLGSEKDDITSAEEQQKSIMKKKKKSKSSTKDKPSLLPETVKEKNKSSKANENMDDPDLEKTTDKDEKKSSKEDKKKDDADSVKKTDKDEKQSLKTNKKKDEKDLLKKTDKGTILSTKTDKKKDELILQVSTTISKPEEIQKSKLNVVAPDNKKDDSITKEEKLELKERYEDYVEPYNGRTNDEITNQEYPPKKEIKYPKKEARKTYNSKTERSGSHFVVILCFGLFLAIFGYVLFQKRKKILGFLIEGRRTSRSRRVSGTKESKVPYTQLDSEDKEAGSAGFKYVY